MFYDEADSLPYSRAFVAWLAYETLSTPTPWVMRSVCARYQNLLRASRDPDNVFRAMQSPLAAQLFAPPFDHLIQILEAMDRRTDFLAMIDAWKDLQELEIIRANKKSLRTSSPLRRRTTVYSIRSYTERDLAPFAFKS